MSRQLLVTTNSQTFTDINNNTNTVFRCQFESTSIKKARLDQVSMTNMIRNFTGEFQDFTIQINDGGIVTLGIDAFYILNIDNFQAWFLSQLPLSRNTDFTITQEPSFTKYLKIACTAGYKFRLVGRGWQKLGFLYGDEDILFQSQKTSLHAYDFTPSNIFQIQVNELPQNTQSQGRAGQFVLKNDSAAWNILYYENQNLDKNVITFNTDLSFNQFNITLLDANGELLLMANDNNNPTFQFTMLFTILE